MKRIFINKIFSVIITVTLLLISCSAETGEAPYDIADLTEITTNDSFPVAAKEIQEVSDIFETSQPKESTAAADYLDSIGEIQETIETHNTIVSRKSSDNVASAAQSRTYRNRGLVWIIEPKFEYERVIYCSYCQPFKDIGSSDTQTQIDVLLSSFLEGIDRSDIKTQLEILSNVFLNDDGCAYICWGHGYSVDEYFFDEEKELFIIYSYSEGYSGLHYYTLDEFNDYLKNLIKNNIERGNTSESRLFALRKIDSNKIETDSYGYDYNFDEAYSNGTCTLIYGISEKYALYDGGFITDYIYDDYKARRNLRYTTIDMMDFKYNGKWGILDKNGNIAVPFIFEDIEFIDNNTAFAKYDGKYGILDVSKTTAAIAQSPATGDNSFYGFSFLGIVAFSIITLKRLFKGYKKYIRERA